MALFVNTLFSSRLRSPEKGVWVIQPFFAYNLTRGEGGANHTIGKYQILRIIPVGDGRRFNLFGEINYSLASDEPYPLAGTPRYVIEGSRFYSLETRSLVIWIKVDKMYEYISDQGADPE